MATARMAPEDGTRASTPRPSPRIWPILTLFLVQALFLAAVFLVSSRHAPPVRMIPVDAIVPAGSPATVGVRLERGGPIGPSTQGIPIAFRRRSDGGPDAASPSLTATTRSSGVALVELPTQEGMSLQVLEARVDPRAGLRTTPPEVTLVIAAAIPNEVPCLLVVVPGTLERELKSEPPESDATDGISPAAGILADLARSAVIGYLVDPIWSGAPYLRERLGLRGFPRGPLLRGEGGEESWIRKALEDLAPRRWKGAFWVVISEPGGAADCLALGARAIILGPAAGAAADNRHVFSAPSWGEVRAIVLR